MFPKEGGFNQSVAAKRDVFYARLTLLARDGEVVQSHHGDTICHPKSGYVRTKLHGTSTCGYNNDAIFSDIAMFTFPTGSVCRPR